MAVPPITQKLLADPIAHFPAATVACFDPTVGGLPRRHLAAQRTVEFLQKLAEAGAPALLIAASTGHGHVRTIEELTEWFNVASQAKIGGAMLTALLRPEDGPEANHRLSMLLAQLGYAVVFVRPGKNLPRNATDEQVAANMQPVVQAAAADGMAVGLYSIPDVSGLPMTPAAAARCLAGPGGERIVAIKVTEASYERSTLLFLRDSRLARLKIVQGWDPHLARALLDGPEHDAKHRQRCGLTSGPMSFAVFQYLHMLTAANNGDWDEVGKAQAAVTVLFQAMQDDPSKFADLQRAKHIMGLGQPLTSEVSSSQVERVFAALESLPRLDDRSRLARSLDLLGDGLYHQRLRQYTGIPKL
jgi:dihydrodipicolinate synthase/N-acetylneuraminate lyase